MTRLSLLLLSAVVLTSVAQADISVSNKPTQNMSCSAGVCTATSKKAVLNVGDLQTMLASGDTTVQTGNGAVNIDVVTPVSWNNSSRLALNADTSINIKASVTVTGSGAVTLNPGVTGTYTQLQFSSGGSFTFSDLASSVIINGKSYVLVADVKTLSLDIKTNGAGTYALANDYDASNDQFKKVPVTKRFNGIFEGLGHTIKNLTVSGAAKCEINDFSYSCTGFFAQIAEGGIVRDLNITNAVITVPDGVNYAGVLAGMGLGAAYNIFASGTLRGGASVMGGLIGAAGVVGWDTVDVDVTHSGNGGSAIGGLAGQCCGQQMRFSHAAGNVDGGSSEYTGGLVGSGVRIVQSSASGSVSSSGRLVGGLIGGGCCFSQSFATGSVTATADHAFAGGFVGGGVLGVDGAYDVTDTYAMGNVTASGRRGVAGGLYGQGGAYGIERSSYAIGMVSAHKAGGFLGQYSHFSNPKSFAYEYWDLDTSGRANGCGQIQKKCRSITGLTDAQLKSGLPEGFDPNIWGQSPNINNGYPYLLANPPQ